MTVHRGEVLRDDQGLPVIVHDAVLLTLDERGRLLAELDSRVRSRAPRAGAGERALLHGVALCDGCGERLYIHRPKDSKRPARYACRNGACQRAKTSVSAVSDWLDGVVSDAFLSAVGSFPVTERVVGAAPATAEDLLAVEDALAAASVRLVAADGPDEEAEVLALVRDLKARRDALKAATAAPEVRYVETGETFADTWERETVAGRRALLANALEEVVVRRGTRGKLDASRVVLRWRDRGPDASDLEGDSRGPGAR
jgi:site-specific DNA recombinase